MEHSSSGKEMYLEEIGGELRIGMEVNSDLEAYNLCNAYALRKGFSICKGHFQRDASNNIRQREFLCSKEGFQKDEDLCEVRKGKRLETRTGCKFTVRFKVNNGLWTISYINLDHNHELAKAEERQFLRSCSCRKIYNTHGDVINSMVNAGIRPTKSCFYLANEVGGVENVGFTKKDMRNYLQRKNDEMIEAGDGQSLLNHFKLKQSEDPIFFYSVQVDQFNRMTNFFWRDSSSKLDYDCFGDVVCCDTTFRTNKYNLICAPFVGVNHHWKNVLFGCAFLLDESTESFVWLFESFMESMGNKQPITIFTDEDKAMGNAIEMVFPQTFHRLCTWHIAKNATQHLASLYANPVFKKQFNKCFHGCCNEVEFQASWDYMINKFDLGGHSWLKKLYSLREKWCPAFSLETFSANIRSTQRSESINNIFHQISTKTMNLVSFIHHYGKKIEKMRLAELEDDYRCKHGTPHLKVKSGILSNAVSVYTNKMFNFFEQELLSCIGVRVKQMDFNELYSYEAIEEGHQRIYNIHYNPLTSDISCSCNLFQSMRILCRHALKVFDFNNLTSIPAQYIMKRWTKEAKKGIITRNDKCDLSSENEKSSKLLRLSELMHKGNNVYSIASMTNSGTKIVKEKLSEAMKLLERDMETITLLENFSKKDDHSNSDINANEPPILNPPVMRAKGITNARLKSNLEK